jgi:hypothetical protein
MAHGLCRLGIETLGSCANVIVGPDAPEPDAAVLSSRPIPAAEPDLKIKAKITAVRRKTEHPNLFL